MGLKRARAIVPEIMDQPGLDPGEHRRALAGLRRIQRATGTAGAIWRRLGPEIAERSPLRVMDVGCGGADLIFGLVRRARRAGVEIEVGGIDISATAIDTARAGARDLGVPESAFITQDALGPPLPGGYDVVMSSLFLHHLGSAAAAELLRRMAAAASGRVLVDDLERSPGGLALAWIGCRVLSRSPVVRVDGPRSVRAAFTARGLDRLARRAGLVDATVSRRFPFRLMLTATGTARPGA